MDTEDIQLDAEDIILLLIEANERLLKKNALSGTTRLEKLLFLLERETQFAGVGEFFVFEPYNFGPFSKDVYEAVDFLAACKLIDVNEKSYTSPYSNADELKLLSTISESDYSGQPEEGPVQVTERVFSLTENGRKVAKIVRESVKRKRPSDVDQLDEIVLRYGTRPLNHLIRYVYRQYPEMTELSIHPVAQDTL